MHVATSVQDDVLVVSLTGKLDAVTAPGLEHQLHQWLEAGHHRVVFDLTRLDFISSAGLRIFLLAVKEMAARKGKLALAGLQPVVRQVFDVAGLSFRMKIVPTVADAVAAV